MYEAARRLAVVSGLVAGTALLSMITLAVILAHWHDALDSCTNADCGCLLYARSATTTHTITGADISLCWFAGLAPLPGFVVAACLAVFFWHRGCIRQPRVVLSSRSGGSAGRVIIRQNGSSRLDRPGAGATGAMLPEDVNKRRTRRLRRNTTLLTVQSMVCGLWGLLAIAHVAVLTDGYFEACHEYRKAVQKTLSASGSLAALVNDRLSCPVIFDFLDYMKPDVREIHGPHHWRPGDWRLSTINTAAALVIALLSSWAHMGLWFLLAAYSGVLARQYANSARRAALLETSL